jgi:succinylarginine dihydrolase
MTELVLLEASLFQLQTAMPPDLEFTVSVLANAVAAAREGGVNAARVSDIEFALNDVIGAADSLSAADAATVAPAIDALRGDVAALKEATALPREVVAAIEALRAKLAARKSAIERQTFVEGGGAPLPHPPEELARDASALRGRLAEAGFSTPALDAFLDDPAELRFHGIVEMLDELETLR